MATDPNKTEKVASWPTPESTKEVQQFLGLAGYYRRFIRDFAEIARPLHRLTERNAIFRWSSECKKAFEELKNHLVTAPVLAYPDFNRPSNPDTDVLRTLRSLTACLLILLCLENSLAVLGVFIATVCAFLMVDNLTLKKM